MSTGHVAGSTPYAWPFDGDLQPARTALVVTGAGSWAELIPDDPAVRARIDELRRCLGRVGVLVVVVAHELASPRLRDADTPAPPLTALAGEQPVVAAGVDGFYGSALDAVLRRNGRTHLLVCGYGLESTVHSTLRRANDRGYECLTIVDASVPHRRDLIEASRSTIEMSGGIFGAVGTASSVLDAYEQQTIEGDTR